MRILITGANRGVGRALYDAYEARGEDVVGTTRSVARAGWVSLDVAEPESQAQLRLEMGDAPLDLLVCNAGVYLDKEDSVETYSALQWQETFAVNVMGAFLTIQTMLPSLRAARGKIAIIGSQMGSSALAKGNSLIYRASKAAALNLGINLASTLRDDGVSVGVYHPGWVQTDMGGRAAHITAAEAADGLVARFDALSPDTSGEFLTWDGRAHPV